MAADYTVIESPSALIVNVTHRRSIWKSLLASIAAAAFCGADARNYVTSNLAIVGSAIGVGLVTWISMFHRKRASLEANNFDFITRAVHGSTISGRDRITRADIEAFYYDNKATDRDDPYTGPGLYARLARGSMCIVPYVNEEQAHDLIEVIYRRFPDMPLRGRTPRPSATLGRN